MNQKLTIISEPFKKFYSGQFYNFVRCKCECGKILEVKLTKLDKKRINSCGCLKGNNKHKLSKHPLYTILNSIKARCYNKKNYCYYLYGKRNIKICDEWRNDFTSFYDWAINNGWKKGLQIDRINNDDNYEPSNCRWTTSIIQANNRRNNTHIECFGESKTIAEWSRDERCKVNIRTLMTRLQRNWNPIEALNIEAQR